MNPSSPPRLVHGDQVGIIATAGKLSYERILPAIDKLKRWGLVPIIAPSAKAEAGYFAGNDELRRKDLQEMLDDGQIKAIFCARGGYGTTRIIDQINWNSFKKQPKWLVGFSDITALHCQIHQLGIQSLHAPTLTSWQNEEATQHIYFALFEQAKHLIAPPHAHNRLGNSKGLIVGGNLCLLAHLIGSASDIDTAGKIIFIEEVGEAPYAIDRLLTQLQRAGKFTGIKGLVVGDLDISTAQEKAFGISQAQMVLEKIPAHIPIAFGMPIGHKEQNLAIPCGHVARLSVGKNLAMLGFEYKNS